MELMSLPSIWVNLVLFRRSNLYVEVDVVKQNAASKDVSRYSKEFVA